jgi:hypothetical protein
MEGVNSSCREGVKSGCRLTRLGMDTTFEPRACAAPNGKLANICKTGAFDRSPVRIAQ